MDSEAVNLSRQAQNTLSLADLIADLGYSCCSSVNHLLEIINSSNPPVQVDEVQVARTLSMMIHSHSNKSDDSLFNPRDKNSDEVPLSWNVEIFMQAILSLKTNFNAQTLLRALDSESFVVSDMKGFEMLVQALHSLGFQKFPIEFLLNPWEHARSQLSLIKQAIVAPPELFNFADYQTKQVLTLNPSLELAKNFPSNLINKTWNCLDLIETLLNMSRNLYTLVKHIFNYPIKHCPEILFLGLAQIKPVPPQSLHRECLYLLFGMFLQSHPHSNLLLPRIWAIDQDLFVSLMAENYRKDPSCISRCLDVIQEMKILQQVLESKPDHLSFLLELASLASRREFLNLEKWLQDRTSHLENVFIKACISFLSEKLNQNVTTGQQISLSMEVVSSFLKCLLNNASMMNPENAEAFKIIHSTCLQQFPRLVQLGASEATTTSLEGSFSQEAEEEANIYFQKIYTGQLSIDEIVTLLQKFKNSTNTREQEIFACMIHNLFDEYRFFPKYPPKELAITGTLFGALIQHQLVSYIPLGIALRYVLEALRKPVGSKMFRFGVLALSQFKSRFVEWPQYCQHILQIPHFVEAHPEIVQLIHQALEAVQSRDDSHQTAQNIAIENSVLSGSAMAGLNISGSSGTERPTALSALVAQTNAQNVAAAAAAANISKASTPVATTPGPESSFTSLNINTLLEATVNSKSFTAPPESIEDKVAFLFNNVAKENCLVKANELKELVTEEYFPWLANYIVVRRVSIEQNQHQLYISLLEAIQEPNLDHEILLETYSNIQVLLVSDKTVTSTTERSLLKNLGIWLGWLTLARNKAILHKHLSLKDTLIQAYEKNRLIVAIPFVCKVLDSCSRSKIFHPPNPWVMGVLRLLVELYHYADLRLNLKFEIEVLLKNLKIDVKDIEPTTTFKDRIKAAVASAPSAEAGPGAGGVAGGGGFPLLANFPLFVQQPQLKRIATVAIERAVHDIIQAVTERSSKIACISTRELVLKDFAMESDENKLRKAAHIMVQNLAASLALVASKDPLRSSIANYLRSFLQSGDPAIMEQILQVTCSEANLEYVCSIIEKAAAERAVREIDEELTQAYTIRKKHRERTGQPYYDMSIFTSSRYPGSLPEVLRLKPNGLSTNQYKVYEDFGRITLPPTSATPEGASAAEIAEEEYAKDATPGPARFFVQQPIELFIRILNEIDNLTSGASSISSLPPNHDVHNVLRQILAMASQTSNPEESARMIAQKALSFVFKSDLPSTPMQQSFCISLLQNLLESSKTLGKDLPRLLLAMFEESSQSVHLSAAIVLLRTSILSLSDLLKSTMMMKSDADFGVCSEIWLKFIKQSVQDQTIDRGHDLILVLERFIKMLGQRNQSTRLTEEYNIALEMLKSETSQDISATRRPSDEGQRNLMVAHFEEWVRLSMDIMQSEKVRATFVQQLQQRYLVTDESSALFYRTCLEKCISNYTAHANNPALRFQSIDGFCKLVVTLLKMQTDPPNAPANTAKINLLNRMLSIVVLVMFHIYNQRKTAFPQKPFFRLFSNLLVDLNTPDRYLDPIHFAILATLSDTFHNIKPSLIPVFAFAWLELISHRVFMPKLLSAKNQKGWPLFQRLIVDLFRFLAPYLRNAEMTEPIRHLYRGTLKVLLVLLHDFPEFLCDYHFSFCDVLPSTCIQLRNLILSAFPRNMRLPDPFTPNLKVDLLPEINQSPRILSAYQRSLVATKLNTAIDLYLKTRSPVSFLLDLRSKLLLSPAEAAIHGTRYNVPVINALVLYVGIQAISQLQAKPPQQSSPITHSAPMDIFQQLIVDLDTEGRYHFLNAIANQLRYPNSHTHYFSCVLLYLFGEANQEIIQEQITRVLLERLIVNRPHPWGLLITFIELIKNQRYNFWSHSFVRCAPEIERLFESVARSCLGPPPKQPVPDDQQQQQQPQQQQQQQQQ